VPTPPPDRDEARPRPAITSTISFRRSGPESRGGWHTSLRQVHWKRRQTDAAEDADANIFKTEAWIARV